MFKSMTCVAVIGLLACGVAVQAVPNVDILNLDGTPTGYRIEKIPSDAPVKTIYAVNSVATGYTAEATIYNTGIDPDGEFGHFMNYAQTTGAAFPGFFYADNMTFGNGFSPGDAISSYEARIYRSSADPLGAIDGILADFRLEMWDGDPFGWIDTGVAGFSGAPIACTGGDFIGIPGNYRFQARVNVPKGCTVPNQRVWTVLSAATGTMNPPPCRMAWIISRQMPTVGSDAPGDMWEWQYDNDGSTNGSGVCCQSGGACLWTSGNTGGTNCPETGTFGGSDRGFCSDGDAERQSLSWFGGPCTGDPATDNCASMVATVRAPAQATITLQPTDGDPMVGIVGNEIILAEAGGDVLLQLRISDWDPDDTGVQLKAWQADLDSSGYDSGSQGSLSPLMTACTADADCIAAYGGACGGFTLTPGAPCTTDADCPDVVPGTLVGVCEGPACAYPTGVGGYCEPGYILSKKSDYVFVAVADLPAVDLSTLDFRYASAVATGGNPINDAVPWPGDRYAGSLRLAVSGDAKGTFTVSLFPSSVLVDQNSVFIPLLGLIPGLVTIQTGQCCVDLAGAGGCVDGITEAQCLSMANPPYNLGPVNFDASKTCADECIECLTNADCKERDSTGPDGDDLCTVNTCCLDPAGCPGGVSLYFCNDPTAYDCSDGLVCTNDFCDPATQCYYEDVAIDDGLDCTADSCVEPTGVQHIATDPDDGDPCTVDVCCEAGEPAFLCTGVAGGTVVNADVTIYPCTTIDDCPAEAQGCALGYCFCDPCPRDPAYITMTDECAQEGTKVGVDVMKPQSGTSVTGAQGTVYWDPTCMQFVSMTAVAPFDYELPGHGTVLGNGAIFFAVGVNPFGDGMGIGDPSPFVHLQFVKIGACNCCNVTVGGTNPYDFIVEAEGYNCGTGALPGPDVCDVDEMTLTVPDGAEVNADCDFPTAIVTWDAPSCTAECGDCVVECTARHDGGVPIDHLIMGGGEIPQGVSTFTCTATNIGDCPAEPITDVWTVTVSDQQTLDVTIQLSPIMLGDVTRCIEFELYENCIAPPVLEQEDLFFGGAYDWLGHYTSQIKVSKGQFGCITARDQHHSLRSVDYPACEGGVYSAVFKGDPFFGGNWLVQGNLDGHKKTDPLASHDVIDILDFGKFVANFGTQAPLTVGCEYDGTHADINGDGVVDELDFSFVSMNFLASSKDACCGAVAGNTIPTLSISVRELRANGWQDMISADLNHDGMLDTDDVSAFLAGERPAVKGQVRSGSGLRR